MSGILAGLALAGFNLQARTLKPLQCALLRGSGLYHDGLDGSGLNTTTHGNCHHHAAGIVGFATAVPSSVVLVQ